MQAAARQVAWGVVVHEFLASNVNQFIFRCGQACIFDD